MGSLPINTVVRSVAVDAVTPERVYAAGPSGLFRSDDAGQNWTPAGESLPAEPLAVTLDPAEPQTVFALLADNSVWRSTDGATTWQPAE
ncbi:MAG TPA: hypothetical protein VGD99_18165 [Anaerolineae bacterium]|jgi:photosystem II stability/assembly factor-like uncharacterized protein